MQKTTKHRFFLPLLAFLMLTASAAQAQKRDTTKKEDIYNGLQFRNIGPAFMSGRIADIVIHPTNMNTWYVAVGSGGVWKTENSGTTWTPVFDHEGSYSIGCLTIDPSNADCIWVGTGENVGGRHVGYGDGIYKSEDGGSSWKNMGLKTSEHLSKIIVHPTDPNTVWVAAQGPLWSKGGERGVYKTTDGGKSWKRTLGDDQWTGATDLLIDPREPNRLYAATWQRHRNVAAYMGGGPGTAIYRSEDGGESWQKLKKGLPTSDMGKIGLAISPQQPDVIYAAIELDRRSGGFYRSSNRGASWTQMSDAVAGATGPHYYQELYASPHQFDFVYLVDNVMQYTEDGGKTFKRMNENNKHVDNHAIAFRANDPDYLLVGNDGGLYETFDKTKSWKFIANLPVTQFYKLAVDDATPFYHVYGGTQDNNTQGGPSRTDNVHGIRNADWFVTVGGDGHQPATEPGNPNIVYSQAQQGYIMRHDRVTGENVSIRPQPDAGEPIERFNWDSPILVSRHQPTRLFYASQRVWKSEDRGDSWVAVSGDLTRNQQRITQKMMGQSISWDAPWDLYAMSDYSTITSLAESPKDEKILWAGTDDGLIQVTSDGGLSWRSISVSALPGVPETAFVNDIKADLFEANTAYVVLDNHKFGDLNPYIYKTTDQGKTWKSIKANLPDRTLVWRVVQDPVKPDLLFAATEFGIWFSNNGGQKWTPLKGNLPVISFRDLAIQERENDLVAASFGRGIFILDDYSVLREINDELLQQQAALFAIRDAWWYIQKEVLGGNTKGSQGDAYFVADNPPFGAVFTYYLKEELKGPAKIRKEKEAELKKKQQDIPFPGWEAVEKERRSEDPKIVLMIKDASGEIVARVNGPVQKGLHRVDWDLRTPSAYALRNTPSTWEPSGPMVPPGTYSVELYSQVNGELKRLCNAQSFVVKRLREGSLPGSTIEETVAFWKATQDLLKSTSAASVALKETMQKVDVMEKALARTTLDPTDLLKSIHQIRTSLQALDEEMNGNQSKQAVGESDPLSVKDRLNYALMGTSNSTYGPTATMRKSLAIANEQFVGLRERLEDIRLVQVPAVEKALIDAGAPWMEGQPIPE